jgi:acyl carrier protein
LPMLPLTGNGRADVTALPTRDAMTVAYVAPGNPLEDELVAIWAGLLGVERVGMLDNFFRLGGHSLLLAQLAGRITGQFGVEIPLQDLFETDTAEKMAHQILSAQLAAVSPDQYHEFMTDLGGTS